MAPQTHTTYGEHCYHQSVLRMVEQPIAGQRDEGITSPRPLPLVRAQVAASMSTTRRINVGSKKSAAAHNTTTAHRVIVTQQSSRSCLDPSNAQLQYRLFCKTTQSGQAFKNLAGRRSVGNRDFIRVLRQSAAERDRYLSLSTMQLIAADRVRVKRGRSRRRSQ